MPVQEATRNVPAAALRFPVGAVRFSAAAAKTDGDRPAPRSIEITALSGEVIPSWYWGPCLQDLAGMQTHKASLPLDYCHNSEEVIGFCDKFDVSDGTLQVGAQIVPFSADDRASEIAYKADQGVPWEASIQFDPATAKIEQLAAGQVSTCNGKQVEGPLTIFRQWSLRGVAVCPYGLDKNTSSRFAADEEFTIPIIRSENAMSAAAKAAEVKPDPAAPESSAAATQSAAEASAAATVKKPEAGAKPAAGEQAAAVPDRKADGKRFLDAFGDRGGKWFAEGLSFEEANAKFTAELKAENEQLKTRLSGAALAGAVPGAAGALSFGEEKPLAFDPANPDATAESKLAAAQQRYGKGFGAFAASIELPAPSRNRTTIGG